MEQPAQQPIDIFVLARDHLGPRAASDTRDPEFCRVAVQLCHDFLPSRELQTALEQAIFSVLKQATWPRTGVLRPFSRIWLSYDMAHSRLGPFRSRAKILLLARSIAQSSNQYRLQLFGNHTSASHHQRQFKRAILAVAEAIARGASKAYFESLPRLAPYPGP